MRRFTIRRRILEVALVLWTAAFFAGYFDPKPVPPGPDPDVAGTGTTTGTNWPGATVTPGKAPSPTTAVSKAPTPVAGLGIKVVKQGQGEVMPAGRAGRFHYTGWLDGFEGKKFDSSRDRDHPFDVIIGQGMVIPGWEQGLLGMKPGEIRRLEIPPDLAYGAPGSPPTIPPNATLYFEVEYLGPAD